MSELCKSVARSIRVAEEFKIYIQLPVRIYCDNTPALDWAEEGYTKLPKHIDPRYNFCCDLVRDGHAKSLYVPSEDNIADILTKPFYISSHRKHCSSLGLEIWEGC